MLSNIVYLFFRHSFPAQQNAIIKKLNNIGNGGMGENTKKQEVIRL